MKWAKWVITGEMGFLKRGITTKGHIFFSEKYTYIRKPNKHVIHSFEYYMHLSEKHHLKFK